MGFLAPIMLVGIIALAVPIAIHLIGRRRARVVKFAALDFLLATKRRTARRFRLRERLLLLVGSTTNETNKNNLIWNYYWTVNKELEKRDQTILKRALKMAAEEK